MGSSASRRSRRQNRQGHGPPSQIQDEGLDAIGGGSAADPASSQQPPPVYQPGLTSNAGGTTGSAGTVIPPTTKQSNLHQTTTVRNLVNLKKSSLCLTPRKDDASVLDITFLIDAVQECNVSIFLMGKEDRKTGQITAKQVICDNARCPVGMNVKFPFPDLSAGQVCIHTDSIPAEQLRSADVSTFQYPLFIRLETLADKAAATQHELSERIAGAPLTSWIQCQTTCAVLGDPAEGEEDSCKVVRQRIWVHELFYDLQVWCKLPLSHLACRTEIVSPCLMVGLSSQNE
uniref:RING-type E3 ubiquitin transferase n=1 Tax=Ulva partita TaxID=1605170 RepID=A0A1C9ZW66_9CHLO|nr:hypothetical protein [Ulva partita]